MSMSGPLDAGKARPLRVFLAEDDEQMRRLLAVTLRRDGHLVIEAADGPRLLAELGEAYARERSNRPPSAVIADVRMPGCDGMSILRCLRGQAWCPPFILITAFADPRLHAEAATLGAHAVIDKPFDLDDMRAIVNRIRRASNDNDTAVREDCW